MAKNPTHHRREWTATDVRELQRLAQQNTPTRVIGMKMGRTEDAVRARASSEEISLKPTNQAPYNRLPQK